MSDQTSPPTSHSPFPSSLIPHAYDALLIVSFGGPEGPDDVLPFLENVTRRDGTSLPSDCWRSPNITNGSAESVR